MKSATLVFLTLVGSCSTSIIITALLPQPSFATGISRRSQTLFHLEETKCLSEICKMNDEPDTNWNCVSKCVSPTCFAQVYGREPLEEGELDEARRGKYVVCVSNEFRAKYRVSKEPGNPWWDGFSNVDEGERRKRDSEWYGEESSGASPR